MSVTMNTGLDADDVFAAVPGGAVIVLYLLIVPVGPFVSIAQRETEGAQGWRGSVDGWRVKDEIRTE